MSSFQSTLEKIEGLIRASLRPLPDQTGDGTYIEHPTRPGYLKTILSLNIRNAATVFDMVRASITGDPVNDKKYLMERAIQLATDLPHGSKAEKCITNNLREHLWNDLGHPPVMSLKSSQMHRAADGSSNNLRYPLLGAANTPYARSVVSQTLRKRNLPDPGVLFDTLLARDKFTPHPTKISSLLFYLASIITHDTFNTSPVDDTINMNSSYLDLSPLYGSNEAEQRMMRTLSDGRLKPDCFADKRLLNQPPGVGVLLIMFNRWHNHAVMQLAKINEDGRFTKPNNYDKAAMDKYDEDLFQTGRLITCNLYCNIITRDYVRTILNLNRLDSAWTLDPRAESDMTSTAKSGEIGRGNQVSAEFNLVYRWHSILSHNDEVFVKKKFEKIMSGQDPETADWQQVVSALKQNSHQVTEDPALRKFAELERETDGSLPSDKLSKILSRSIEEVAGAFGANHIPKSMRAIEILGILRARKWNLATLNEFRAHFNLKKHETFEDINPDPKIAGVLKHLYDHPDQVELYPGLVVEEAKDAMSAGSGLCTTFTISRAILSDAVALVRGDRFLTVDCTPRTLTNWGFKESGFDLATDKGHCMYKLILRAFPTAFKPDSVYAHFPFTVPCENQVIHLDLGIQGQYDYSKPTAAALPIKLGSHAAAVQVLNNPDFKVVWGEKVRYLTSHADKTFGGDFMLSGDNTANSKSRCVMSSAMHREFWEKEVSQFYTNTIKDLISRYSATFSGHSTVDIVRDVINLAQAHFAAEVFCIPTKTAVNPRGIYTEHEVYLVIAVIFMYIFFDGDPMKSFPLRNIAKKFAQQLGGLMEMVLNAETKSGTVFGDWFDKHNKTKMNIFGMHMLRSLLEYGHSVEELVWTHVLPTAVGMVANQGQLMSEVIEFYLRPENDVYWKDIIRLSSLDTPAADDLLQRYILEASRLNTSVGVWRSNESSTTVDDDNTVHILSANSRVFVNFSLANQDPVVFPEPTKVDLTRPVDSYLMFGQGRHACIGRDICLTGGVATIKVLSQLPNLRKAPGPAGDMGRIDMGEGLGVYLNQDSSLWPFPATMKVEWDFVDSTDGLHINPDGTEKDDWTALDQDVDFKHDYEEGQQHAEPDWEII